MISFSYLKSQMFIENLRRIDSLRTQLHSLILTRENERRFRWETRVEQIYYDLSLYDLSFSKKSIAQAIKSTSPPVAEKELLIYRWKEALSYIDNNCFFRQEPLNEDSLYEIFRIIQPKLRYQPFQELPEYVRYAMTEDHPVTRAALLQLIVYNLQAFPSLNEPFSHLAYQLVLTWSGWNLRGFVCIEEQYFHDRAYYKELIRNTYTSGNVTQWIEYVSEALIKQFDHIIETYSVKQHSREAKNEFFILNDRQKKILSLLDEPDSSINNRSLQKITGISQMTAARDLAKLVEHGLITSHGKGRGVTYTRN